MRMGYLWLLVFVVVSANELQCERVGYKEYLELYSFKPSEETGNYYEYAVLLVVHYKGTLS